MNIRAPRILISIVTWNHEKTISSTIDSVLAQQHANCEIVVFDNNSGDKTVEALEKYRGVANFTLICNNENIGFCGGHNHVIRNFSFDYLVLVNPDLILMPDYLAKTIAVFDIDPGIGAVCGLLVQSEEEDPVIDSSGMMLKRSRRFVLRNHGSRVSEADLQSGYVSGLDGALPAFRKEALDSLLIQGNLFNPMFFAHKEDWDVSWRLLLYDWKIYFNKESIAVHPRLFKPSSIRERLKLNHKIRFDAFKNQFLLLMINEDRINFLKDAIVIIPRICITSFFCLFIERKSLKAYSYIFKNRREILAVRKLVQAKRKITPAAFRKFINA